jgi:hypothetical protein
MARSAIKKPKVVTSASGPGHLIVQDKNGSFYFIPADKVGAAVPVDAKEAEKLLKRLGHPLIGLKFAMLISEHDALVRMFRYFRAGEE